MKVVVTNLVAIKGTHTIVRNVAEISDTDYKEVDTIWELNNQSFNSTSRSDSSYTRNLKLFKNLDDNCQT